MENDINSSGPAASIIIPTHNCERTILECIKSIYAQSAETPQIVICDDASNDETPDLIKRLPSDKSSVLLRNPMNLGPGPSRDRAIEQARGEWVSFVDSDDRIEPQRLSRLFQAALATNADVVFDDLMMCHDAPQGLVPWNRLHGPRAFNARLEATLIRSIDYIRSPRLLVKPMIRAKFIRDHGISHSSRRFGEDAEFMLELFRAGAKVSYLPEPLYWYRITPGSLTAQADDPSLMRRMLEEQATRPGWSEDEKAAFMYKIKQLKQDELLYTVRSSVQRKQFSAAARLTLQQPVLAVHALRRMPKLLFYRWHRLLHAGRSR